MECGGRGGAEGRMKWPQLQGCCGCYGEMLG